MNTELDLHAATFVFAQTLERRLPAAFARAASFEVVTFDKGLRQYRGIHTVVLP